MPSATAVPASPVPNAAACRTVVCVRNDTLREVLADGLSGEGLGPVWAIEGAQALSPWSADGRALDVLVIDIDPQSGGSLALCHTLRAAHPAAVIVALATSARAEDRIAALDAGADQLLAKPLSMDELLADIRRVRSRGVTGAAGASEGLR